MSPFSQQTRIARARLVDAPGQPAVKSCDFPWGGDWAKSAKSAKRANPAKSED